MAASMSANCRSSLSKLNLLRKGTFKRYLVTTTYAANTKDVVQSGNSEVEYPPVLDTSYKGTKDRETKRWHRLIQDLPTVQEKQLELNMSRYYGHWSCHLSSHDVHYNHAEFVQFATRSKMVEVWPEVYATVNDEVNRFLPLLKKKVEDILLLEMIYRYPCNVFAFYSADMIACYALDPQCTEN